ncbi:MAG: cation transporter [Anaerolineae bacterium]|nr:cation transporter [Anaerolineae bacterium]
MAEDADVQRAGEGHTHPVRRLFRDALHLALGGVPADIDLNAVRLRLEETPGVQAIHDLHVWALSTTETALTVHMLKPDPAGDDALVKDVTRTLENSSVSIMSRFSGSAEKPCLPALQPQGVFRMYKLPVDQNFTQGEAKL